MSGINWTIAPEWATVRLVGINHNDVRAWAETFEHGARALSDNRVTFKLDPICWRVIAERPAPAWTGTGLPPVGLVVRIPDDMACGNDFLKQFEGLEVEIVGHSMSKAETPVAVFRYEDRNGNYRYHALCGDNGNFEPLRTPEQIAAEERELFAKTLVFEMGKDSDASPNAMNQERRIYDLGYRKQEIEQ